jgi:hypothetical protein
MRNDSEWSPRFAVFGDMGNDNAQSLVRLQEETMNGMYDAILHVCPGIIISYFPFLDYYKYNLKTYN